MKTKSKYKLVILTPGFPESEFDTTCLPAIQQFVLCLQADWKNVEVVIITLQYPFIQREYSWNNINVVSLGGSNKGGYNRILIWIKCLVKLFTIRRASKIDGVLSLFLTECSLVGKIFSKLTNTKHYTWLIGQETNPTNRYVSRIRPKESQLIAMSNMQNQSLFNSFGIRASNIIENGINESIFEPFNTGIRSIDILGAGALIDTKKYNEFLEIVHQLKKQGLVNLNVILCGDGDKSEDLKIMTQKLGLSNNVVFKGRTTHQETLHLMNNAKVFLHPSVAEASSTVMMEALYSGCHTVAHLDIGIKQIGQFYKLSSKDEMVNLIYELLSDTNLQHERICYNSMHQSVSQMMKLFLSK